jgi:hypothetical protein
MEDIANIEKGIPVLDFPDIISAKNTDMEFRVNNYFFFCNNKKKNIK